MAAERNLEQCYKGKHNLIDIFSASNVDETEEIVRWCKNCGSIVVDLDYDGRTQPGRIMRMRHPGYLTKDGKS